MSAARGSRHSSTSSAFDTLLADLLQVVAEILLIRKPRVQTASVAGMTEPPPDLLAHTLLSDTCPFCPGGKMAMVKEQRLLGQAE